MSGPAPLRLTATTSVTIGRVHRKAVKLVELLDRRDRDLFLKKVSRPIPPTDFEQYAGGHIKHLRLFHTHVSDNLMFNWLVHNGAGTVVFIGQHKDAERHADKFHKSGTDLTDSLTLEESGLLTAPATPPADPADLAVPVVEVSPAPVASPQLVALADLLGEFVREQADAAAGDAVNQFHKRADVQDERADADRTAHDALARRVADLETAAAVRAADEQAARRDHAARLGAETTARGELAARFDAERADRAALATRLDAEAAARVELTGRLDAETAARAELVARVDAEAAARGELADAFTAYVQQCEDDARAAADRADVARAAADHADAAAVAGRAVADRADAAAAEARVTARQAASAAAALATQLADERTRTAALADQLSAAEADVADLRATLAVLTARVADADAALAARVAAAEAALARRSWFARWFGRG